MEKKSTRISNDFLFYTGNPSVSLESGELQFDDNIQTNLVVITNVPASMDIYETIERLGQFAEQLSAIRVLKTQYTKAYGLALKFKSHEIADSVVKHFKTQKFSFMEEERILIHKIDKYYKANNDVLTENNDAELELKPAELIFELTKPDSNSPARKNSFSLNSSSTSKQHCPICLESLGNGTCNATIICLHSFHLECLRKWQDESCPICRYQQYPFQLIFCSDCNNSEDIWSCIICGYIGCGPPSTGHISLHAASTNHIFSKKRIAESKGVWDHLKGDFIHRIIIADGHILSKDKKSGKEESSKGLKQEDELSSIIAAQIDSQKQYYEKVLKDLQQELEMIHEENQKLAIIIEDENTELSSRLKKLQQHSETEILEKEGILAELQQIEDDTQELNFKIEELRIQKKKIAEETDNQLQEARNKLTLIKTENAGIIAEIQELNTNLKIMQQIEKNGGAGSGLFFLEKGNAGKKRRNR